MTGYNEGCLAHAGGSPLYRMAKQHMDGVLLQCGDILWLLSRREGSPSDIFSQPYHDKFDYARLLHSFLNNPIVLDY